MNECGILVDGQVVVVELMEWARWYDRADRRVAFTKLLLAEISTVFLGVNYQFSPGGRPLWFGTRVVGGSFDNNMERYETLEEAMQGHERMVAKVRDAVGNADEGGAS